ncbi:MAG: RIP metalloprotease RseP [Betaproteobacteria bacterium]|jgi:regulator of sigma E protease|nr:MAG: RIP metalloprotease RseP [Betaproteobacteria bacterium]
MQLILTLGAFILALGILIVFHEYGHYLVARLAGVKVLRFSVGFGAPLVKKRFGRDQTEWVVAVFPFGGYVKMLDEREGEVAPTERHRAFNRQSVWRRIAIVAAGPIANFLLAILLYWVLFATGVPGLKPVIGEPPKNTPAAAAQLKSGDFVRAVDQVPVKTWQELRWELLEHAVEKNLVELELENEKGNIRYEKLDLSGVGPEELDAGLMKKIGVVRYDAMIEPVIGEVVEGDPASRDGLLPGDYIESVDGSPVQHWAEVVASVRVAPSRPVVFGILRDGVRLVVTVDTDSVDEGASAIGRIGAAPKIDEQRLERLIVRVRYPVGVSLYRATLKMGEVSIFTLRMLGRMIIGDVSLKNLSGPITIADYAGQSAKVGWIAYLNFLALISISLGVLNLLPVPVLDGGHLMYYLVEIVKGSPVSERALELGQRVGLVLLFALMAFAIYNDIIRLAAS